MTEHKSIEENKGTSAGLRLLELCPKTDLRQTSIENKTKHTAGRWI